MEAKHIELTQAEKELKGKSGIALTEVKGDVKIAAEDAMNDLASSNIIAGDENIFTSLYATKTHDEFFDVFLVFDPKLHLEPDTMMEVIDWCKKYGNAMTIEEYFPETKPTNEMNIFDIKKRKIMSYEEFAKDGALDTKHVRVEKGENEIVKKAMSGEVDGAKGYDTLENTKK